MVSGAAGNAGEHTCARVKIAKNNEIWRWEMRGLMITALALFLGISGMAHAADAQQPAAQKPPAAVIGVVDMQSIAMESDPAKAAKDEMESKYGKEKAALEKRGAALKKQAESLKNPKTSDEKRRSFITTKQKLDQDTRNFVRKVEQDEVKFRQDMVTMIYSAAYQVARAKGFNFVVDIVGGGVLYADKSMDITKDVMAEVNRLYQENKNKAPTAAPEKK